MLLLVLLACLLAAPAWAQDPAPRAGRAAPAPVPSNPGTTATERWVWEEVRAGRTANLHARCGVRLDPHRAEDARWGDDCRRLTAGFLERVLTSEGWRAAPAHRGVSIVGARVAEPLDLAAARVEMEVWLDESRFDRDVTHFWSPLRGLAVPSGLRL